MIVSVKKRECLFWYALVVMQIFILLVTVKSNRVAIATLLRVPVRGFFYFKKLNATHEAPQVLNNNQIH